MEKELQFTGTSVAKDPLASKVGDQVRMIHAAHDLMEHRHSLIENGQAQTSGSEPLVLNMDEYAPAPPDRMARAEKLLADTAYAADSDRHSPSPYWLLKQLRDSLLDATQRVRDLESEIAGLRAEGGDPR